MDLWNKMCQGDVATEDLNASMPETYEFFKVLLDALMMVSGSQRDSIISAYEIAQDMMNSVEAVEESMSEENSISLKVKIVQFVISTDYSCLVPETVSQASDLDSLHNDIYFKNCFPIFFFRICFISP